MELHGFNAVTFAMEATSLYFFHIANSLSNAEELQLFHVEVYCLNAKIAKKYKDSFLGMPKTNPSLMPIVSAILSELAEPRTWTNGVVLPTSLFRESLDTVIILLYSLQERRITY